MDETLKALGTLEITVRDEFGNIKDTRKVKNVVTNDGKGFIASRMVGTSSAVMSHMGLGTGSANPTDPAQTALGAAVGTRVTVTATNPTATSVKYSATFPAGNPATAQTITEAGVFNALTGATMLCRTVFSAVNKGTSDSLTIDWTVNIT